MKISVRIACSILVLTGALFVSNIAAADVIYTYTGKTMNVFACSVGPCPATVTLNGSVTFTTALGGNLFFQPETPGSYDFTVAGQDFKTGLNQFTVSTDASGKIIGWQIGLSGVLVTSASNDAFGSGGDSYNQSFNPVYSAANQTVGSWGPGVASVPEPCSMLLLGTGALGVLRKKLKR